MHLRRLWADRERRRSAAAVSLLTVVILGWFWPITILGRQPIGGDVTSFFYPLMAYYSRALQEGRVPLWNELWGFGFPGLAESQMGVFYPPHLMLFRLFEPATAYTVNLVVHQVLCGWFAYLCARGFGVRQWGAALAGLVYAGNGFFIIHLPHQWAYETGAWVPLAVWLAWRTIQTPSQGSGFRVQGSGFRIQALNSQLSVALPGRTVLSALGLAGVLAVQMLAGHFQLAFYTQVTVVLVAVGAVAFSQRRRWAVLARSAWLLPAVVGAFVLAAVQLLPTWELAKIALPDGHDWGYLSGFANSPVHLISYLAPTLFHVNPLWRPVAWDPWHTSPEECLSYVGVVALFLALAAAWRWRRKPKVRVCVFIAAATLLISLGPYLPGFRYLIELPGFGFFRAYARWSVVTALFLAVLAGMGLETLTVRRLRRHGIGFSVVAGLMVGLAGGAIFGLVWWGANVGMRGAGVPEWANTAWWMVNPWGGRQLREVLATVVLGQDDATTLSGLAGLGYQVTAGGAGRSFTLAGAFFEIMRQEVLPALAAIAVLFVTAAALWAWRRQARWILLAVAVVELTLAGQWLRPVRFGSIGDLQRRSALLNEMSETESGLRWLAPLGNLPMAVGAAPLGSYRTLDIPIRSGHFELLRSLQFYQGPRPMFSVRAFARLSGVEKVVFEPSPFIGPAFKSNQWGPLSGVGDEALDELRLGGALTEQFRQAGVARPYWILNLPQPVSRGWVLSARLLPKHMPQPLATGGLDLMRAADRMGPAELLWISGEEEVWKVDAKEPAYLVMSDLYYPGWRAVVRKGDADREAEVENVLDGWRGVRLGEPGVYEVKVEYRSRPYEVGRVVSGAAWALWVLVMGWSVATRRRPARA